MTVTLCIDTSTAHCSLALAVGDQVFVRHERLQRRHNEQVLPMLDALFGQAGVSPMSTELIAFGAGPGSFTGVRIAASITQGIALASDSQVVPILGSEVLLHSALNGTDRATTSENQYWLTVVPSRADAYYLALYRTADVAASTFEVLHTDRLYTEAPAWIEELSDSSMPPVIVGSRPSWLSTDILIAPAREVVPDATRMIDMAKAAHQNGFAKPAHLALPVYVEGDSPWRKANTSTLGAL